MAAYGEFELAAVNRGVVTATMSYDALPINDAFRKVDNDTVVGAMDLRGLQMPFVFVLRREPPAAPEAVQRGGAHGR